MISILDYVAIGVAIVDAFMLTGLLVVFAGMVINSVRGILGF